MFYICLTKIMEIMLKPVTYKYSFKNGTMTISRKRFDWHVSVDLNDTQMDGYVEKNYIKLNQAIFLTRKHAKETTEKLLQKYNLL